MLLPPASAGAIAASALALSGRDDAAVVVIAAILAYAAGLDVGFGALPLMHGRSFRWSRPLDPEPARVERDDPWCPPWERF